MHKYYIVVIVAVLVCSLTLRGLYAKKRLRPAPPVGVEHQVDSPTATTEPEVVPGIFLPELCPAHLAHVADISPVIGVVVNGEARAYLRDALEFYASNDRSDLSSHVINDVVGGIAVTVTRCNLRNTTRVFTSTGQPTTVSTTHCEPLDVGVGGWDDGMLLVVAGQTYHQASAEIPLTDMPFENMSWKEWVARHPDTLVYTGYGCLERELPR